MLPYAGFYTMRSGWKPGDQFFFFRAGPLGIGHEHEDMLRIEYEAFGKTLLREEPPSGYDHSSFRRFALNTGSYSDITVDGMGQHREANRPPVTAPAKATWFTSPLFDYAAATYDGGYQKNVYDAKIEYHPEDWIGKPDKSITHTWRIVYLRPYYVLVLDSVNGPGRHTIDLHFNVDSPAVRVDEKTQAAFSKNQDTGQVALYPLERSNLKVSVLQGERGAPDVVWDVPTVQFEKQQETPATFATLLYPYRNTIPDFRESAVTCANSGVWARSVQTSREMTEVFIAKSGNPTFFSVKLPAVDAVSADASLLIVRSRADEQNPTAVFGALALTEFKDASLHLKLDQPRDLLFTVRNGHPVLFNPGDAKVTVRIIKPFARAVVLEPGTAIEVTREKDQSDDPGLIFRMPG